MCVRERVKKNLPHCSCNHGAAAEAFIPMKYTAPRHQSSRLILMSKLRRRGERQSEKESLVRPEEGSNAWVEGMQNRAWLVHLVRVVAGDQTEVKLTYSLQPGKVKFLLAWKRRVFFRFFQNFD